MKDRCLGTSSAQNRDPRVWFTPGGAQISIILQEMLTFPYTGLGAKSWNHEISFCGAWMASWDNGRFLALSDAEFVVESEYPIVDPEFPRYHVEKWQKPPKNG